MIAVALWVTQLPGSVGRVAAFGVGPLLLGSGGLLVVCLLRSPLRFAGATRVAISAFARRARLAEAYGQPTSPTRWRYGRHHEDQQRFIRRA
jgi:hypothetical protein